MTSRIVPPPLGIAVRSTVDGQGTPAAAPRINKQTAPAPASSEAPRREEAAVFETAVRPSTEGSSGTYVRPEASADVPAGAQSVLQTRLTHSEILKRVVSPTVFSPERTAEIGAAFEKANHAGSLEWKPGVPRALNGIFFAAVNLPNAPSDGYTYRAYAFVGEEKSDPNSATEVYVTREGGRRDYARISLAGNDASDAQSLPRRSPAEELWKARHGHYPDENRTIMDKMNWEYFRLDLPE